MVTAVGLFRPEKDPVPLPAQPVKTWPTPGVALIETRLPAFWNPLAGLTVPPVPVLIVSMYWVVKMASSVVLDVGLTVWEIAPPSLQADHRY
jgi:hypothetical protein